MAQLRQGYSEYEKRDTEILVVGPERAFSFAKYWEQHALPFIGLPDPEHRVLKLYGQEVKILKLGRMPAQVIVDRTGHVRYAHYGHSMKDIPKNDALWRILDSFNNVV